MGVYGWFFFLGGTFCFSPFFSLCFFCSTGIEICWEFSFCAGAGYGRYINLTWEGDWGRGRDEFCLSPQQDLTRSTGLRNGYCEVELEALHDMGCK